jgi:hypothetical protein
MGTLGDSDTNTKEGFLKYIFNFDEDNKNMLLNLFQYAFISVPFIILVLKLMNYYTPEEDDKKGTLEILLEIVASISIILLSIWFINKLVRYIPTYSKSKYVDFNEINFIIPLFIVLFTMQTKLGGKINILVERLVDLYDGKTNLKEKENTKNDFKTTQPISQTPGHQPSQADFLNQQQSQMATNITSNNFVNTAHTQPQQPQQPQQQSFNNSFQGPNNPLVDAAEPMAANEVGMFGGSLF